MDGDRVGQTTDLALDHPLFAGVFDSASPRPESIDIRRIARYRPGGADETTLVGTQTGAPLLQEIRSGEGSVLLFGVAPDLGWSDLPQRGLFVPLLYRAAAYLAAGSSVADTGDLASEGSIRVEGAEAGAALRLVGPDGTALSPPQRTVPGAVLLDAGDVVGQAGLYRVVQGERTLRVVAVNEDARESDPAALDPAEAARRLEAATGRPVRLVPDAAALAASGESAGVPWWTVCLALALACLVAETVVASRWRPASA